MSSIKARFALTSRWVIVKAAAGVWKGRAARVRGSARTKITRGRAGAEGGVAALSRPGVIGVALAMSSTAVVLQVLSEKQRLNTTTGRSSFAILLFQDLAVVPVLLVLAALGPTSHAGSMAGSNC